MSGSKGGVHALLQRELNKEIPYTHCLNHQLHLVIAVGGGGQGGRSPPHSVQNVENRRKFGQMVN